MQVIYTILFVVMVAIRLNHTYVFEINEQALDESKAVIRDAMVGAAELDVPLIVDIGVGNNWDQAH